MSTATLKRLVSDTDFCKKPTQCEQCGVVPGVNPLSEIRGSRWCKGCKAFFSKCRGQEEVAMFWVRTGEWPENVPVPVPAITDDEIMAKFKRRARQVNLRPRVAIPGFNPRVTARNLKDLYERNGRLCQFSGLMAYVYNGGGDLPFWAASVDHIHPVNGTTNRSMYGMRNLQIMISIFNSVKSNHTDAQLREWYNRFLASL